MKNNLWLSLLLVFFLLIIVGSNVEAQMLGEEYLEQVQVYTGTFQINGDKDTYYPVVFKYGNQNVINHLRIYRSYHEKGPVELSPTHKGGLTLEIDVNYGGWGGAVYDWRIMDLRQQYHKTFANATIGMHRYGFIVWLRGGGFIYHYKSDKPAYLQVAYSSSELIYDHELDQYDVASPEPLAEVQWDTIYSHKVDRVEHLKGDGSGSFSDALRLDAAFNRYNLVGEKTLKIFFPNSVPNQKVDVYFDLPPSTRVFWGNIEVEITSNFSYQNSVGSLKKVFSVGLNPQIGTGPYTPRIYDNTSYYCESTGVVANNWAIDGIFHDATNGRYYFTLIHRVSTQNSAVIKFRGFGVSHAFAENISSLTAGSVYTTDSTLYHMPVVEHRNLRIGYASSQNINQPDSTLIVSGSVGIGTTNPQSKLAVNGTITSKELKVIDVGWSDFVFKEDYELPSLNSVESYIKKHKHLPKIPPARAVEENGIAVSDMLAKQMQKIEEMTLYLIQLKKENDQLKERLALLEKSNKATAKYYRMQSFFMRREK